MSNAWIIVANSSRARVFQASSPFSELKEIQSFVHNESRMRNSDLAQDRQGRSFNSVGQARHAIENTTDPQDVEKEVFAKQIGNFINRSFENKEFTYLYLYAGADFLGMLRPHIAKAIQSRTKESSAKDYTMYDAKNLRSQMPDQLWSKADDLSL